MLNFQRIICIWICCVSCMFGTTQLSTSLVQAVPYEYFDDHDQSFYDLDTEQIQAKYDTRLLTQQMLPTETQKGFYNSATRTAFNADGEHRNLLEGRKQNNAESLYESTAKLKTNDGSAAISDDEWLEQEEETATKAASSTSAFTDTLDELHLPRAASCFTNGQKYTHGQKVPRLDNCEVCLCMDGEIFCWWEKCDKNSAKTSLAYDDFSTPFEESSTTRIQLNSKTTYKTTLKPMKKPKTTNEDYKYDDDDSAEIREMQQEYEGLKEQLLQDEHADTHTQKPDRNRSKQSMKKKIYQKQEEEKHKKKIKEQNENWKQQQQQKQLKTNEHYEQHHHAHNHNNNNNNNNRHHHDNGSSGSNSKILNFPENLPSVLYYDYKTEEHHQHQHQHREQHLKHQKQKQQQQQHEKELKQRQQKQEKLLQQQQKQHHHNNRHHEYGQDFHTFNTPEGMKLEMVANIEAGPSTAFKYFSNGNDNIFNEDLLTDSDILPEPPTKKPKLLTSIAADTIGLARTTGATPLVQLYRVSTATAAETPASTVNVTTAPKEELLKTTTILTSSTPLKKQILSAWDSDKTHNNNTNKKSNIQSNTNNKSTEEQMDAEDQDDAFHRWLTSTETNNKNNFTLNETASREEENTNVLVGRGFDGSNSDYNGDERNYENMAFETDAGFSSTVGNTKQTNIAMAASSIRNTETAAGASFYADETKINGMFENEENFSENNRENGNNNGIINYNSPFSQNYENFEKNNNQVGSISGSSSSSASNGIISSTASNEDNGVASVVNIDIMLTASSAETQQQQQQLENFKTEQQITNTHENFMQTPHIISNTSDTAASAAVTTTVKDNSERLSFLENDNTSSTNNHYNNNNNNNKNSTTIVGGNSNIEIQNMGVNLLNKNNNSNNITTTYSSSSSSDSFKLKNSTTNATSAIASTVLTLSTASTTPPILSTTTSSPERQCNVMGTLYKIGDILPQDTGNCLQCVCIDGSTSDDTPRVTCSPHNCPPLVLPDLFDATGY